MSSRLRTGQTNRRRIHAAANAGDFAAQQICPEDYYNPCGSCGGEPRGGAFTPAGCYTCSDTGKKFIPRGLINTVRAFPLDLSEMGLVVRYACLCLEHVLQQPDGPRNAEARALIREATIWVETGNVTASLHQARRAGEQQRRQWNLANMGPLTDDHILSACYHMVHGICGLYAHNMAEAVSHCYKAAGSTADERQWQLQTFSDVMTGSL